MIKSRYYDSVLDGLIDKAEREWDLERLETSLTEARHKVSDKRWKMKQREFEEKRGLK